MLLDRINRRAVQQRVVDMGFEVLSRQSTARIIRPVATAGLDLTRAET